MKFFVWYNQKICEASKVCISPLDRGFQFGDGLFETVRIQRGRAIFLEDHIERLKNSLKFLNFNINHAILKAILKTRLLNDIIKELLLLNNQKDSLCRMKIIVSRGIHAELSLPVSDSPNAIVVISSYREPESCEYLNGWNAITLPDAFTPCLAPHKCTAYLFYLWAKQQAIKRGAREAIIPDKDGMVAEGTTTNVLLCKGKIWYVPQSRWQLPGITIKKVISMLKDLEYEIKYEQIPIETLHDFDTIWLLNSMIGVMPLRSLDKYELPDTQASLAERIRNKLFNSS